MQGLLEILLLSPQLPYTVGPYTVGPYTVGPYTVGPYTVGPYTSVHAL